MVYTAPCFISPASESLGYVLISFRKDSSPPPSQSGQGHGFYSDGRSKCKVGGGVDSRQRTACVRVVCANSRRLACLDKVGRPRLFFLSHLPLPLSPTSRVPSIDRRARRGPDRDDDLQNPEGGAPALHGLGRLQYINEGSGKKNKKIRRTVITPPHGTRCVLQGPPPEASVYWCVGAQ